MATSTKQFVVMFVLVLAATIMAFNHNTRPGRPGTVAPMTVVTPRRQVPPKTIALTLDDADAAPRQLQVTKANEQWSGRLIVRAGADGHVFVVDDRAGGAINEYLPDGRLLEPFHVATGMPAIKSVTDLAVTDKYVWIVDLVGSSVHAQDRKTRRWLTTAHRTEPYRLLPLDPSGSRLAIVKIGMPRIGDVTDSVGNPIWPFAPLLVDQSTHSPALDGFVTLSAGKVIFSGKYLGVLSAFTTDGQLSWIAELVGKPETPAVVTDGKRTWVEHAALLASQAVSATDTKIIVLSARIADVRVRSFIDIYSSADGAYQKSLELPLSDRWTSIAINRGGLYVAGDAGVLVWPAGVIEPNPSPGLLSAGRPFVNSFTETGDTP